MQGSAYSATEEGRAFLQERLALFGRWVFFFSGGFYLVGVAISLILDPLGTSGWGVLTPQSLYHAVATLLLGGLWWLCRSGSLSLDVLRGLDAGVTIATCAFFGLMGASMLFEPIAATFVCLLAATHTVVFRAIVVPSTAGRTAWISAVAFVPIVATAVYLVRLMPYPAPIAAASAISTMTWCALATGVAVVASQILFGLRREVREAKQLGQYTLEEKIGEGGMGAVYRARHMMLRRPTAIKLLPPAKAGEESIRRFEREVQLTARLSHPNTVAIYDYGRTPDGVFYYAMEFLDGVDLQALVRADGPQAPERVIHILTQVCGALREAHEVDLIHRDIKPANIILTTRGGEPDVVKVVDFGLVKHVDTGGEDATVTAARNLLIGSPLYMSPEAIRTPDEVDARSDLYALGAVGYYLLTGQAVFDGDTFIDICSQHLQADPTPPSKRLGLPVPSDLEALVMDCLAKAPDDRPPSARAMSERLRACANATGWTTEAAASWWAAHRARPRPSGAESSEAHGETVDIDLGARRDERRT